LTNNGTAERITAIVHQRQLVPFLPPLKGQQKQAMGAADLNKEKIDADVEARKSQLSPRARSPPKW